MKVLAGIVFWLGAVMIVVGNEEAEEFVAGVMSGEWERLEIYVKPESGWCGNGPMFRMTLVNEGEELIAEREIDGASMG